MTVGIATVLVVCVIALAIPVQAVYNSGPSQNSEDPKQSESDGISVELRPHDTSVGVGDTVTYAVVATDVSGGVGAYNLTVTLEDGDVAEITDVSFGGDPGLSTLSTGPENNSVQLVAGLADTADTGNVVVANITVRSEAAGQTAVDLTITELGDENGASYPLDSVGSATLTVEGSGTTVGDSTTTVGNTIDTTTRRDGTTSPPTTPPETSSTTETTVSGDGGPGFTPVLTISALIAVLLLAVRRE